MALARMAQREDDLATADKELAEIVRLDPGYTKAQRQRQVLAATAQEHFEEPYRWDALEQVGAAQPKSADNEPVAVVNRTTVWRVNPDGTVASTSTAQNLGGVKASTATASLSVGRDAAGLQRARDPRRQALRARAGAARQRIRWRGFDLPPQVGDPSNRVPRRRITTRCLRPVLRHGTGSTPTTDPFADHARGLVVSRPRHAAPHLGRNAGALKSETTDAHGNVVHRWVANDLKRPAMESAMPQRSRSRPW
jgi:hypothetical protein